MVDLSVLVEDWLKWDTNSQTKSEVQSLYASNPDKLLKAMYPRIAFGTAGLRAEMGPGFALMNILTVTQASQGLAKYVSEHVDNALERGIVIGYDHRHNSHAFAEETARAFAYLGFKIHYLGQVHTPLVPYGISKLNASCGVMITASHNPAKDNGYKVYWENACQLIPPHDSGIAATIESNLAPWNGELPKLETIDLLPSYLSEVIDPLSEAVKLTSSQDYKIVYTPMHGVGLPAAYEVFKRLGINSERLVVVKEQAEPDADFRTVAFPNPEEKGALDLAIKYGNETGAQLIVANDPDADRFSAAVRTTDGKGWKQLTGDQIGTLFASHALKVAAKRHPEGSAKVAVVNSTVSSKQMAKQAELAGAKYFETLTGFKWIGNKAIDLEKEGYDVPFAYEEAIGYMLGKAIKDKDGISALHVFVQVIAEIISQNQTALEELDSISRKTGFFATHNSYYVVSSPSVTVDTFKRIRTLSKSTIGDLKVSAWRDLTEGYDSTTPDNKPVLPTSKSTEMITVDVILPAGESARFTARGSGTEPKLKVYIEATASSEEKAQEAADRVWDELAKDWFAGLNTR